MDKKMIGKIKVMLVAVATVVLVFSATGCGCKNDKKTEVTDANGNVVTNVSEEVPTQTDKNGKVITGNNKAGDNVGNVDKSNGDDINDLIKDKKVRKSSKKDKASNKSKTKKSKAKKSETNKKKTKNGEENKNNKSEKKKKGKKANFDVKDKDDEPGFGPLIDG